MTWYWWSHWFWITNLYVLCITDQINVVGTYPMNPPYGNKEYSKEKPLKFPLAAQTDVDDVNINGEKILSAVFRENKPVQQKDTQSESRNIKPDENIVILQSSAIGEAKTSSKISTNNTLSEAENKLNMTKAAVDVNLVNNNSSLVSTQSSLAIDSSETDAIGITEITKQDNSQHSASANNNSSDYDNNSGESLEESPQNKTSSMTVEILNENKNPSIKSYKLENITKEEEIIRSGIARQLDGERGRQSKVLAEYRQELKFNFSADTKNLLTRSASISLVDFNQEQDDGNISSEALSVQRAYILDAGAILGICFAVAGLFCGVSMAGIILYRRRYLNKPQALSEPDSSGYIDDSTIRDNSDEMYSLDNDSFLNSLEAMTIQNYWTDTVKHTKL